MKAKAYRDKPNYNDPNVKEQIKKARDDVQSGKEENLSTASKTYNIPYGTLRNRFYGYHKPAKQAHDHERLLNSAQEEVLVDWIKFLGPAATLPVGDRTA